MNTTIDILEKIKYYCAYQERSHKEVRSKLIEFKVYGNDLENIIIELIEENFLNEERFACALARGKFYFKHWGRNKIKHALKQHQVSDYCIKKAMQEVHEEDYLKTIEKLTSKKMEELKKERNSFAKMNKLKNYLLQKGYEYDYISEQLKLNFKN
jgi:regulatory protein